MPDTNRPSQPPPDPNPRDVSFEQLAAEPAPGLVAEFIDFLKHNKKWWLTPLVLILLLLSALVLLTNTAAGPFIYVLF